MKNIPPEFIDSLVKWFAYHQSNALRTGKKLNGREIELAKEIGCQYPDKIRVIYVDEMPKVKSPILIEVMDQDGFNFGDALGLCLGYGIFLKKDGKGDSKILAHEITHTLQFERFEGVREFLTAYIQEFLIYGYSAMPLEKEARSNEKLGTRILGK
ncbi:MAG: hypothetical protein ACK5DJ_05475 [Bacteroidota bacterium]|jgi:hypothetical protein